MVSDRKLHFVDLTIYVAPHRRGSVCKAITYFP